MTTTSAQAGLAVARAATPLVVCLLSAAVAAGCAPDTDLVDEPRRGSPAEPLGPAGALLLQPVAGAADVPPNLAAVVVRFVTPVTLSPGSLRLCRSPNGEDQLSTMAEPVPCPDSGFCYRMPVVGLLPTGATCVVEVRPGLVQEDGTPVPPGIIGRFDTATAQDQDPPQINALTLRPAGACLTIHFATSEPANGEVLIQVGDQQLVTPAGVGIATFDLAVGLRDLPPSVDATVRIRAVDRAGNRAETAPVPIRTPSATPPLVITEVLANPAGREPDQEFVEIKNTGTAAIELGGLRIEDSRGADVLPSATLLAGAYALIVASTWDGATTADTPARPSAVIVRVDTRLGADGLSNAGEPVLLRAAAIAAADPASAPVISSYGGYVDTSAAGWSGKSVHRLSDPACDHPSSWNRSPQPATPGWGPP
ncbi:MAG TPA: lamin tail domain-containing protein [Polyangia bacterium]|jgi:hypothetical protein|nr:lamin tail domain-containing protein [Polyangia bacterium]